MVTTPTPHDHAESAASNLIDVVVMLRPLANDALPTPSESKHIVHTVLERAAQETGLKPASSTVFEHMNSFSVRAASEFVDAIARSASVAQVVSNEQAPVLVAPTKRMPAMPK